MDDAVEAKSLKDKIMAAKIKRIEKIAKK